MLISLHMQQIPSSLEFIQSFHDFTVINSTNTYLLTHRDMFAYDGFTIAITKRQTHGRGQYDRLWRSPDNGDLYLSVGYRTTRNCVQPLLSLLVGSVICKVIFDVYATSVMMKWPNDIFYQGVKIGGILVEQIYTGDQIYTVIGIGISKLSCFVSAHKYSNVRYQLADKIITRLHSSIFVAVPVASSVIAEWQQYDLLYGMHIRYTLPNGASQIGIATGVDPNGRLQVTDNKGIVQHSPNRIDYFCYESLR